VGDLVRRLDRGRLLDVVQDRTAMAGQRWIAAQPVHWRDSVATAAIDPYQGYATALHRLLPDAEVVVDHFHVIRLGNAVVDEVRRRVQQQTLGYRGRKGDPLYDIRKLLLVAREKLADHAHQRIETASRDGDPWHEVEAAWYGRELLRDVYAAADLAAAETALEAFFDWADHAGVPELSRLARTLEIWRSKVLAYHHRRLSSGRTEAMNLLIKKVKRVGFNRSWVPQLRQLPNPPTVALRAPMERARHRQNQRPRPLVRCVEPDYCSTDHLVAP
jgi:transposase